MNINDAVTKVLSTGQDAEVDMEAMNNLIESLQDLGFDVDEDWETNGWDVDFWIYCTKDEKNYRLSGSWYYGKYIFGRK